MRLLILILSVLLGSVVAFAEGNQDTVTVDDRVIPGGGAPDGRIPRGSLAVLG